METQLAKKAFGVMTYSLELQERLRRGEMLDIESEQSTLTNMLNRIEPTSLSEQGGDRFGFLGVRYALACWLDELFIVYSPWPNDLWNMKKMEIKLFGGTSERYEKFWTQAELARKRPGVDALEVYFLCVMLGFRGKMAKDPAGLQNWVNNVRREVSRASEWASPQDRGVTTNVEPLLGRDRLRRQLLIQGGVLMAVVLIDIILLKFTMTS